MEFEVVVRTVAPNWSVTVTPAGGAAYPVTFMDRVQAQTATGWDFPRPRVLPAAPSPLLAMTAAQLQQQVDLLQQRPIPNGRARAFGIYLFQTLLGPHWDAIVRANGGHVDLILDLPPSDRELTRLPWELMCLPGPAGDFLAASPAPRVSLVYRLPGPALAPGAAPGAPTIHPRVLFVIGDDPEKEQRVRAGYEFVSLLGQLDESNHEFKYRVLLKATEQQVSAEVQNFCPSIVHFICHGRFDATGAFLRLRNNQGDPLPCYAADLLRMLNAAGAPVPVVVLNACETATVLDIPALATSLAGALIAGGVPLVVGMAGEVADGVCRLFARQFYGALLAQDSLPHAVALGRRAALRSWPEHENTLDWALPRLFVAAGVPAQVSVNPSDWARYADLNKLARQILRRDQRPFAFCDRVRIIDELFPQVLASATLRLLLLRIAKVFASADDQLGKTRVINQLAARAAREGHLPVIPFQRKKSLPTDFVAIADNLVDDFLFLEGFNLIPPNFSQTCELTALTARQRNLPGRALSPRVLALWNRVAGEPPEVRAMNAALFAAALLTDAVALGACTRPRTGTSGHVVLFLDDAHLLSSPLLTGLQQDWLSSSCELLGPASPLRLVLTIPGSGATVFEDVKKEGHWLEGELSAFNKPSEDPLPYNQFLLYHDSPLVLPTGWDPTRVADPLLKKRVAFFVKEFQERVEGIPSRLKGTSCVELLRLTEGLGLVLRPADDNDVLLANV